MPREACVTHGQGGTGEASVTPCPPPRRPAALAASSAAVPAPPHAAPAVPRVCGPLVPVHGRSRRHIQSRNLTCAARPAPAGATPRRTGPSPAGADRRRRAASAIGVAALGGFFSASARRLLLRAFRRCATAGAHGRLAAPRPLGVSVASRARRGPRKASAPPVPAAPRRIGGGRMQPPAAISCRFRARGCNKLSIPGARRPVAAAHAVDSERAGCHFARLRRHGRAGRACAATARASSRSPVWAGRGHVREARGLGPAGRAQPAARSRPGRPARRSGRPARRSADVLVGGCAAPDARLGSPAGC